MPSCRAGEARGRRVVLVTGGTGFVGSAVVRELLAMRPDVEPHVLSRSELPQWMVEAGVVMVRGDLTQPSTVEGLGRDVFAVLHLASQIGGDPATVSAVNERGTATLLAMARQADISRVLYVSTCAVYGGKAHRGETEAELVPAPVSITSRSRLAAERLVLANGGVVLRPHLLYGEGDAHVVPTLLRWIRAVPAWAGGAAGRTSLCAVRDLAAAVVALLDKPWQRGSVFHVNHPEPVGYRDLITMVCELLAVPPPRGDLPIAQHHLRTTAAMPQLSEHQYSLLTDDHWYASDRIWRFTGISPGPGLAQRLAEAAPWYRRHLP
jgi:nucleoside-diphosphate-sugar epimerase